MWRLNQKSAEAIAAWVVLLSCALPVTVLLPRPVRADSLPASVAACATEHDTRKRLACYDREVARFAPAPPAALAPAAAPSAAVSPTAVPPVAVPPAAIPPTTVPPAAGATAAGATAAGAT